MTPPMTLPPSTTYHFDYEPPPRSGSIRKPEPRGGAEERKPVGFVFANETSSGAYYYDLRTRKPIAAGLKRAVDLLGATVAITLLAPVYLIIMALIKLTSPGPII